MLCITLIRMASAEWPDFTQRESDLTISPSVATLTINTPGVVTAGDRITITVSIVTTSSLAVATEQLSSDQVSPQLIQLFLLSTTGTLLWQAPLLDGKARFVLDESITSIAGAVKLLAIGADQRTETTMMIMPGSPVEPLLALVGPRSITADGKHWTMLTALPNDAFGNAVADKTPVVVRVTHPPTTPNIGTTAREPIEVLQAKTGHLLAWFRIHSRAKAGRMYMAANAGDTHSPERSILAVPGAPSPFSLRAEPIQLTADGRRLVTVIAEGLTDTYANPLLDGTAALFMVTDGGGERRLPAQIIDGKATVQLQAPATADSLTVKALILNTVSSPLTLTFDAGIGVESIIMRVNMNDETISLIAGPLLGPLGQYIPDGSEVHFMLDAVDGSGDSLQITAPSAAGFSSIVVRRSLLSATRYTARVTAGMGEGELLIDLSS